MSNNRKHEEVMSDQPNMFFFGKKKTCIVTSHRIEVKLTLPLYAYLGGWSSGLESSSSGCRIVFFGPKTSGIKPFFSSWVFQDVSFLLFGNNSSAHLFV